MIFVQEPVSDELEQFIRGLDCPSGSKTRIRTACHSLELKTVDDLRRNLLAMFRLPNMGRVTMGHVEKALHVVKGRNASDLLRLSCGG